MKTLSRIFVERILEGCVEFDEPGENIRARRGRKLRGCADLKVDLGNEKGGKRNSNPGDLLMLLHGRDRSEAFKGNYSISRKEWEMLRGFQGLLWIVEDSAMEIRRVARISVAGVEIVRVRHREKSEGKGCANFRGDGET